MVEGQRLAHLEAERRVHGAMTLFQEAAEAFQAARARLLQDVADDLQALALAVARELVLREVSAHPDVIRDVVRRALELAPADAKLRVRLHPEDLATIADWRAEAAATRGGEVEWAADPEQARGGCVAETAQRVIDGRVDQALLAVFDRIRHV